MTAARPTVVAVDARDPASLAAFWCAVLGTDVVQRWTDAHGTAYIGIGLVGELADPEGNEFWVLPPR